MFAKYANTFACFTQGCFSLPLIMNDACYDSDWPWGLFSAAWLCQPAVCTAPAYLPQCIFPVLSKTISVNQTISLFQTGHPVAVLPLCDRYSHNFSLVLLQESTEIISACCPTGAESNTDWVTSSTNEWRQAANSFCKVSVYLPLSPGAPGGPVKPKPAWALVSRRHSKSVACKWVPPQSRWGGWTALWMYVELAKRKKMLRQNRKHMLPYCAIKTFFFHRQAVKNFVFCSVASSKFLWSFLS